MIQIEGAEYFTELLEIKQTGKLDLSAKYHRIKFLFERLCRQITSEQLQQFPNFFSRLSFIQHRFLESAPELSKNLSALRVRINDYTEARAELSRRQLDWDIYILSTAVEFFLKTQIPQPLIAARAVSTLSSHNADYMRGDAKRMRVSFVERQEPFLIVVPDDSEDAATIKVMITPDSEGRNPFAATFENLYAGAQLNLLQVNYNISGAYYEANIVVLEPDFLLDISSLSACYCDYGHHALNYFKNRLTPDYSTRYIILGNIANQFLDDIVNETSSEKADYQTSMKKAFRNYPVDITTCPDLQTEAQWRDFFEQTRLQYANIRKIVSQSFPSAGIDASKALLEPSFVCEMLGLQGRLDFLQEDYTSFIELKSGKANEIWPSREIQHKESHYVQMMLYYAILRFNMDIRPSEISAYLLYSRYPQLYNEGVYWGLVRSAIDLRNQIVALEYLIQLHNDPDYTKNILLSITPDQLNQNRMSNRFWEAYLKPSIENFTLSLKSMSDIESDYFCSLFTFITREQYTSKAGDTDTDIKKGVTMLWNATLQEKIDAGEIIYDMTIAEIAQTDDKFIIRMNIPGNDSLNIPNFRAGDGVLLYQRRDGKSSVVNSQVFKMTVETIDSGSLVLTSRMIQRNRSVLPLDSLYAIERDYMDTSFSKMIGSLCSFIEAGEQRKSLILSQRTPRIDRSQLRSEHYDSDVERVIDKAAAAQDYFLLVGPPGTGKTSCALRGMVERFLENPQSNILLLAYTNKAVDEICRALISIENLPGFIRIGSESACDENFRPNLLKNVISECANRQQIHQRISSFRIFVSTIASMSQQSALFRLKSFDAAIVDEATQILEPQILGLLSARDASGRDAIRKFVLIGDYKQLPAIVVQTDEAAFVKKESLRAIGMRSLKESFFERLFRHERASGRTDFCDMLTRQGRMHPQISEFPSRFFYNNRLGCVNLPHQMENWDERELDLSDLDSVVAHKRLAFFAVRKTDVCTPNKINVEEARLVSRLIRSWLRHLQAVGETPDIVRCVGIITPYRSQIAMIRRQLQADSIPQASEIVIDTVERFQGGQRDLMIYSCCMNEPYQMNFLSNLIEDEGEMIDRKLNVALTRARKQMLIVGNPDILRRDAIYGRLLDFIDQHNGCYKGL